MRKVLEVRYDVSGLPEWEVDALESEATMIAEASSDYTEFSSEEARAAVEIEGWTGHRSVPAPSLALLEDDDRTERVAVFVSVWNAQRVRDLLFTLRDVDAGENVSPAEIEALAGLFPELPEDFGAVPVAVDADLLDSELADAKGRPSVAHPDAVPGMVCADCGREVEDHPSGLCDSCETQARYDAAADEAAREADRLRALGYESALGQAGWGVCHPVGFWVADAFTSEEEAWATASQAVRSWPLAPGSRVRLSRDVERYPHFVAPTGALGTVVDIGDPQVFAVRMDEPIEGAEDWGNGVHWFNGDDPREDLGAVPDPDYWRMSDADLAKAWHGIDAANLASDYDGSMAEALNMIEDAILQRIGAPEDASGDDPFWQDRIRTFGKTWGAS